MRLAVTPSRLRSSRIEAGASVGEIRGDAGAPIGHRDAEFAQPRIIERRITWAARTALPLATADCIERVFEPGLLQRLCGKIVPTHRADVAGVNDAARTGRQQRAQCFGEMPRIGRRGDDVVDDAQRGATIGVRSRPSA